MKIRFEPTLKNFKATINEQFYILVFLLLFQENNVSFRFHIPGGSPANPRAPGWRGQPIESLRRRIKSCM